MLVMSNQTREALFSFHIHNDEGTTTVDYTHQIPAFLCSPSNNPAGSARYMKTFIDTIRTICAQHHDECMSKITRGCATCEAPVTNTLESPMSYLHKEQPKVIVQLTPLCGKRSCELNARQWMERVQHDVMSSGRAGASRSGPEHENEIAAPRSPPREGSCEVCKKPGATRACAGCGKGAYCSRGCQRTAWKSHKQECRRQ